MALPLFPQPNLGPVRRGDIFALGRHRLACIDATDKAAVARLFAGQKPTLVVTSPPYADARDYNDPIPCWDSMMLGALDGHAFADDVQMLVNLGVIHRRGEVICYWAPWVENMRARGWAFFGQYVWDKKMAAPGHFGCRLAPAHEYVFHVNRAKVTANKWVDCVQRRRTKYGSRSKNGNLLLRTDATKHTHATKAPCSIISVPSVRYGEASGHPAQMPAALAVFLIRTWRQTGCLVYDPFGGSGTTLLACQQESVDGLAAEISPQYVQLAIDRWRKAHPDKPVRRITARELG